MNNGKIASRTFLILFLSGIAFGLFMVVTGDGVAASNIDQGGGGLAVLFGWGFAGLGYFIMAASVLFAGIPWLVTALISHTDSQRNNHSEENQYFHADNTESGGLKSAVDSQDIPSNLISAAWKGDEKLWKVFWIYQWLFGIAFSVALDFSADFGLLAELAVRVAEAVWVVWVVVAQWRCSFNARWRGWGYVVRVLLFFTTTGWVLDTYFFIFPDPLLQERLLNEVFQNFIG
jgi:hypothetical protein